MQEQNISPIDIFNAMKNTSNWKALGPHWLAYIHLFYIDDLKLFAESQPQLQSLIVTTKIFSNAIKMTFGLDKCASLTIKKGML